MLERGNRRAGSGGVGRLNAASELGRGTSEWDWRPGGVLPFGVDSLGCALGGTTAAMGIGVEPEREPDGDERLFGTGQLFGAERIATAFGG